MRCIDHECELLPARYDNFRHLGGNGPRTSYGVDPVFQVPCYDHM
jgi:hypothetical protein